MAACGRGLSDTIQNSPTAPPSNQPLKREHRSERTQRPLLRRRFYRRMSGLEIFERLLRPSSGQPSAICEPGPRPRNPALREVVVFSCSLKAVAAPRSSAARTALAEASFRHACISRP